jgi:CBS domain containing-hemolysin-like protein
VLLQMVVLTPLFLILGESLPKEVFRLNADSWPYALSPVVKAVRLLATVTLILPAVLWVARLALRAVGEGSGSIDASGRRRLLGLLAESAHAGSLSGVQGALAERALRFERTTVGEVMVPWRRVDRLRADWSNEAATDFALRTTRTWLPVTDRLGRVRGVVHAVELIASSGELGAGDGPEMVEPVFVSSEEPVRTAIGKLAASASGIAVVRAGDRPVGLVGRQDLVAPLLGHEEFGAGASV